MSKLDTCIWHIVKIKFLVLMYIVYGAFFDVIAVYIELRK